MKRETTVKKIPILAASSIGKGLGYTQVIITAFDKETGITSVTTWGKSTEDCEQAAIGGNFVKKALGWPPEKCNDKASRQLKKEKKLIELLRDAYDARAKGFIFEEFLLSKNL